MLNVGAYGRIAAAVAMLFTCWIPVSANAQSSDYYASLTLTGTDVVALNAAMQGFGGCKISASVECMNAYSVEIFPKDPVADVAFVPNEGKPATVFSVDAHGNATKIGADLYRGVTPILIPGVTAVEIDQVYRAENARDTQSRLVGSRLRLVLVKLSAGGAAILLYPYKEPSSYKCVAGACDGQIPYEAHLEHGNVSLQARGVI